MNSVITSPFNSISNRMGSHRSAQGVIYASMIQELGEKVTIDYGSKLENFDDFDKVYVYHGNDWGGSLNFFGGMKGDGYPRICKRLADYGGEVISIGIEFPDYAEMIGSRLQTEKDKGRDYCKLWDNVNLDKLSNLKNSKVIKNLAINKNIVIGDSHSICMYRPGWMINSVPFKTLYGALDLGLDRFIESSEYDNSMIENVEVYFGNIDIRHHLMRTDNPEQDTIKLVDRYVDQCENLYNIFSNLKSVKIYDPLPIENEIRVLPKSGYYKGTPFFGSWAERNKIRSVFIDRLRERSSESVKRNSWTDYLENSMGELDFKYMEDRKSVHLSRKAYPHWQEIESSNALF